tara:strand:+ start:124 stop:1065 length:942 start_codon:yes stop_codon:yes gene_type:complete
MKNKILYLGPKSHLEFLEKMLLDFVIINANDEVNVDNYISDCQVIFDAYMKVEFSKQRLFKAKNLKLFITATTGFSHINKTYLDQNNIPLYTLADQKHVTAGLTAAAEHTWLLLMSVARKLTSAFNHVMDYNWDRNIFPGLMFKGKTLGIIGCGRIGGWMSKYANGFGMNVIGYDLNEINEEYKIKYCDIDELLSISDFVSINVPLNNQTTNLLSESKLKLLKKSAVLVNTSRGEVLDENFLLHMLKNKLIGGAGLDVLIGEPNINNHPLINYAKSNDNLIITPHIGGFSPESLEIVFDFSAKRIKEFFNESY